MYDDWPIVISIISFTTSVFQCLMQILPSLAGMQAFFEIKKCFPAVHKPRPFGEVRQYFIAAEEVIWDYGPTQINQYTSIKLPDDR